MAMYGEHRLKRSIHKMIPQWFINLVLAFPVCACLTIELYNLPASRGSIALSEYLKTYLLPDALLTTLAYIGAFFFVAL